MRIAGRKGGMRVKSVNEYRGETRTMGLPSASKHSHTYVLCDIYAQVAGWLCFHR